ncbi:MAG: hypothetical protein ABSC53_12655 [Bacteroidota bacterium]
MKNTLAFSSFFALSMFLLGCGKGVDPSVENIAIEYTKASYDFDWGKMSTLLAPENLREFKNVNIAIISRQDSMSLALDHHVQHDTILDYTRSQATQALPPDSFFVGVMNVGAPTIRMRASSSYLTPTIVYLGAVNEGYDTLHVVLRIRVIKRGVLLTDARMLSMKRCKEGWRVIIPESIVNTATSYLQLHGLARR